MQQSVANPVIQLPPISARNRPALAGQFIGWSQVRLLQATTIVQSTHTNNKNSWLSAPLYREIKQRDREKQSVKAVVKELAMAHDEQEEHRSKVKTAAEEKRVAKAREKADRDQEIVEAADRLIDILHDIPVPY